MFDASQTLCSLMRSCSQSLRRSRAALACSSPKATRGKIGSGSFGAIHLGPAPWTVEVVSTRVIIRPVFAWTGGSNRPEPVRTSSSGVNLRTGEEVAIKLEPLKSRPRLKSKVFEWSFGSRGSQTARSRVRVPEVTPSVPGFL